MKEFFHEAVYRHCADIFIHAPVEYVAGYFFAKEVHSLSTPSSGICFDDDRDTSPSFLHKIFIRPQKVSSRNPCFLRIWKFGNYREGL